MSRALFILAIALMSAACSSPDKAKSGDIVPSDIDARPGDIVFRLGTGFNSAIVVHVDDDGEYSHTGIVIDSCGTPYVVHAVPNEPDFPGDYDRVKCEPLSSFYDYTKASCGEICRVSDPKAAQQAAAYALDAHRRGIPFDHDYDNSDTTKLYCCQLVTWVYEKSGITLVDTPPHELSLLGFGNMKCTLPSDILKSPYVKRITCF